MRQRLFGALLAVLLVSAGLSAQTFQVPIAQAIALLTSGTTVFTIVGVVADGYINFDTGRSESGYGFRDNGGTMQVKNEGGDWSNFTTSGGAPSDATYITRTTSSGLSAEFALASLGTALLVNTTGTGTPTAYAGASCTNQFPQAISAIGALTCDSVVLTTDVSGTLPVANGGTGATTLTGMLRGNGTSAFTAVTSSTVGQVLRVTGANTMSFGAVDLDDTDAVTGSLGVSNGGTNLTSGTSGGVLGYTASGTLASSVALTANNLVLGGGAGATPTPLGSLGTTSQVLIGNAAGAPSWGSLNVSALTGTLGPTVGGTGLTTYTTGDVLYASAANTLAKLASVSAGSMLRSGGVTTAPVWSTTKWTNAATAGDVLYASGANTYANLAVGGTAGMFIRSTGTLPAWSTLVLPNAATVGDLPIATTTNTMTMLAAVAVNRVLCSAGVATAPTWCTSPTLTSVTTTGAVTAALLASATNCADSAGDAACVAAPAGGVVVDAGDTATVVSTTAVTANSQIFIVPDMGLGTRLSVTCNATTPTDLRVTARTAGTSFTITVSAPVTNPLCVNYLIVN